MLGISMLTCQMFAYISERIYDQLKKQIHLYFSQICPQTVFCLVRFGLETKSECKTKQMYSFSLNLKFRKKD